MTADRSARGWSPFAVFGGAAVVAAAWGIYMGLAYVGTPHFVTDDLPTIVGVATAVVAFLVLGLRAPPNE